MPFFLFLDRGLTNHCLQCMLWFPKRQFNRHADLNMYLFVFPLGQVP